MLMNWKCHFNQWIWSFWKSNNMIITTLALGSWPKQRVARLQAKRKTWESHHMLLGVPKSVREWTLTLPSELPCWELESQMDSRIFKTRLQGSKPIGSKSSLYHWKKLLKRRYWKWACIAHLDIWNTSYGQKKGWESNRKFDSRPLKVGNRPDFLVCRQCATYRWKSLDEGYNFSLDSLQLKVCTPIYAPPKLWESQLWEFWDSHLGVSGQKVIWMWPPGELQSIL
jgi:hypothetical protein